MRAINKADYVEFIAKTIPGALSYLIKKGVCGISCGEPLCGTLEAIAKNRDFTDAEIDGIVIDLNNFLATNYLQNIESEK
jgi:hypothetical protein